MIEYSKKKFKSLKKCAYTLHASRKIVGCFYSDFVLGNPTVLRILFASSNLSGNSTFAASLSSDLLILTIGILVLLISLIVIMSQRYNYFFHLFFRLCHQNQDCKSLLSWFQCTEQFS